ncbi:MAG: LysE family transporter [Rhodopila sp.]|jgi:threonine/homoserine/homoserine lactone efflux protein
MTLGLLIASSLSGAAVKLAPGPAFLALLEIGASRGRRAGALFMCGHFVGDLLWASLALTAIIGARTIGSLFFDILGLVCGVYLCWLGVRSATARRNPNGAFTTAEPRRPWLRGLLFGLSNPKAYPVAVAMFTSLLARYATALDWGAFAPLLAAACAGVVTADAVLIAVIGAGVVRQFYRRHALRVTRLSGVVFLVFGVHAIATAAPGVWRKV